MAKISIPASMADSAYDSEIEEGEMRKYAKRLELTGQLEMTHEALKSARRPLRRIVKKRFDIDGIVAADLRGVSTSVKAFVAKK